MVDKLKKDYDAYSGTTIELVEDIVHMITESGEYASDGSDED